MVTSVLNKKLFRDLLQLKTQVLSISMVVGIGIAVLFGFTSTYNSLKKGRDSFYLEAHFSDVWVTFKKAPLYLVHELSALPGVLSVEPGLTYPALLSLPKMIEPAVGQLVSIPNGQQPTMNRIFVKAGRLPSASAAHEVVVSEGFFQAHSMSLGERFFATLNGRREELVVVGMGVSPEYIIALQGGSPLPDDLHFGVIWINQSTLAELYDMKTAFNRVALKISPQTDAKRVVHPIEQNLKSYGVLATQTRDQQISHVFVSEELKQLEVLATSVPIIFFLVAAYILHVVISRLVQTQRSEIATLKAVGYQNWDIVAYYFKIAVGIVTGGTLFGVVLGIWMGRAMTQLYTVFYHFPQLRYDFNLLQIALALLTSIATAGLGVYSALKNIFKLQPAEAMRPPAPPQFQSRFFEKTEFFMILSTRVRMAVRGITAFPRRSLLTLGGLSLAIVLLISGLFWSDSMDHLVFAQYSLVQKETGSIQLAEALEQKSVLEIRHLPAVLEAEGYRSVGVKARHRNREQATAIRGFPEKGRLQSVINEKLQEVTIPEGDIVISKILAHQLRAEAGDTIEIEVLEGRKPKFYFKINKIVDSFLSGEILTHQRTLARLLHEDIRVNQILFRSISDPSDLYIRLKEMPQVLSVTYKESALRMFEGTSAKYMLVFAGILTLFAGAIGFGITYNNMQVTLAERDWELATLRILGFYVSESFMILAMEFLILLLFCIPLGWVLGFLNSKWLLIQMSQEAFQIPFIVHSKTFVIAGAVLLVSAALSGWVIYRRIKNLDLIATLKTRG